MSTPPLLTDRTSSIQVAGFMATSISISFFLAVNPLLFIRMVYQVGRPAMLEGKRFLAPTGMPILKRALSKILLADWEPLPLTVATQMLQSLTIGFDIEVSLRAFPGSYFLIIMLPF